MKTLTLGYSPCPNDTFIFYALGHGRIDTGGLNFNELLLDVETLNQMALRAELDITKVSYHALCYLRKDYCLLRSGSALGRGCGPLIVVRGQGSGVRSFKNKRIAIPGELTTAFLLLKLYLQNSELQTIEFIEIPFNKIMDAIKSGDVDAGLIIHEGRFTYPSYGLKKVIDLGEWWEEETGLPIPLGGILAKRNLGKDTIKRIDSIIRKSIEYALKHRDEPKAYIKQHSQELGDDVIEQHINLYVNDYSIDIGEDGISAVKELLKRAELKGIIKPALGGSRHDFLCDI